MPPARDRAPARVASDPGAREAFPAKPARRAAPAYTADGWEVW